TFNFTGRRCLIMKAVSLLLLFVITVGGAPQKSTPPVAVESLAGIGIGTSLEEAQSKLSRIGTGNGRDTREGGRKEAWTLAEGDFNTLAFKTNKAGHIVWVSAFVRPGREVLLAQLGDPAKAATLTKSQAIWNVGLGSSGYRLVAKGAEGKASVVYLLSLDSPEVQ
ncbi:MAG TPA: hypothetical protein VK893_13335, partial [Pyrinomonadaceae bacterium]|nr:hypothetical protein [Pyrinomonadaceae bacterium]